MDFIAVAADFIAVAADFIAVAAHSIAVTSHSIAVFSCEHLLSDTVTLEALVLVCEKQS